MSSFNRFKGLIEKIKDDENRCWFCNKSEEDIRAEYRAAMLKPENAGKEINIDEVLFMSYETKAPICAGCYF